METVKENLNLAIESYIQRLEQIETKSAGPAEFDEVLLETLIRATDELFKACQDFELIATREEILQARALFQKRTDSWISKSYFMQRARVWPRGYPGDFETLEAFYQGYPVTKNGIGLYLDVYSLSRQLALGIRERRAKLQELLSTELAARPTGTRVLNIACGPCRELFELALELNSARPQIICVDNDQAALEYGRRLLISNGIALSQITFLKYNALRLINPNANARLLGEQDLIYSAGLFDYLPDEVLVKILSSLYQLLSPGGRLIAPFKDCRKYPTGDYHWLSNWTAFLQRTEEDCLAIFRQAGIPENAIKLSRDKTEIMLFFVVSG